MALTGKQKQQYEEIKRRRQAQNATTQGARVDTTAKPMPKVLTPDLRAGYDRYLQSLRTPTMTGDVDPRFSGSLQSSTDLGRRYRAANYQGSQERPQREAEQLREGYQKFLLGKHDTELAGVTAPAAQAMEKQRAVVQSGQRQRQVDFYSPNAIHNDLQQKENRLMGMQQGASQYVTRLENAEKALMAGKKKLEALKPGTLEYQAAAGEMEQLWANYQAAYEGYQNWGKDYNREYSALETERARRMGAWEKTIREASDIEYDLKVLEEKIRQQERLDIVAAHQPGYMGTGEDSPEMAALKQEKARLEEELGWSRYYKYDPLMASPDFAEKSKYVSTANGLEKFNPVSGTYSNTGFDDITYDYINRNPDAVSRQGLSDLSSGAAPLGLDRSYLGQMTDREISIFNYLYATKGADSAYAYTDFITTDLTYRQRREEEASWAAYAAEAPGRASAFSVLMAPTKGFSYLGQAADYLSDGTIDQNAGYNKFSYAGSAIRNQVAQQIEASGKWGKVGSFAYQTGMSMGDFLMTTAVSGGNQALNLAIMGTGAAADTTIAAKDRGLSDDKAFALGTVAGLAEIATEKIGLDALFDTKLLKSSKLGYVIKNALSEGTEEVSSSAINLVADILIAKDESQWRQSIESYMAEGLTESEAIGRAVADQALSMGVDLLGGMISGGVMGGGGAIVQQVTESNRAREISQALREGQISPEFIQKTMETAMSLDPGSRGYRLAEAMQKKVDAGQEITARELGQLWQANEAAIEDGLTYDSKSEIYQRAAELHIREPLRLFEASVRSGAKELGKKEPGKAVERTGMDEESVKTIIETGLSFDPKSKSYKLAEKLQQKQEAGKAITAQELDKLWQANIKAMEGELDTEPETGSETDYATAPEMDSGEEIGAQYFIRPAADGRRFVEVDRDILAGVPEQDGDASQGKSTSTLGDAELQAAAKKLPELYRKNFLVNGKGVTNVKAYKSAYEAYAMAGRIAAQTGKEGFREAEEMYSGGFADILSEEAKTAAYTLGKEEGRQEIKGQEAPAKLGSGRLIDEGGLLDNAPGLKKLFELAAKRMHIDLTINDEKGYNGRFIAATMAMALSTNGNLVQSFGHELGEYIGAFAPAEKEMLRKNLIQWWVSHENEKDIDSLARRYQKSYAKKEGQKSYADALDEIVYDALGALLTTKEGQKGLLRFLQGQKTSEAAMKRTMPEPKKKFLRKLKEWVERIGRGLKAYLAGKKVMPDSQRFLDMELNDRVKLLGEFFRAAERAIENAEKGVKTGAGKESSSRTKARYSFAGEKAKNADLAALARAKEMQAAGIAEETIRQQTGWHMGMDGKWRWEIDDSGMEYSSRGDLGLRERRPEYARYRELLDKAERHALELSNEALTPEEAAELQKLKNIWGGTFRKAGRITEDALPTELLSDYVKHDALFEAYPQLRKTRLRFADLPEGARGQYDPEQDIITLSNKLRGKPQDTLIHEIQHVIQKAEGFAQGSSPEFWAGQTVAKPEYAREIQKAKEAVERVEATFRRGWDDDINLNLVKRYIELEDWYWGDLEDGHLDDEAKLAKQQELMDQMEQIETLSEESGWKELFDEYYYAVGQLRMAKERAKMHRRTPIDLYSNTAGEIEARDVAARRTLTPEQRRERRPAHGDSETVFAEGWQPKPLSIEGTDSEGRGLTPEQQDYFKDSKARDEYGRLEVLYHQTDGEFTIFDTKHKGAGSNDDGTPFGIFLKRSADDIGLKGKKQMPLYANITNPLRAENRGELKRKLRMISSEYAEIIDAIAELDWKYKEKHEKAGKAWEDYIAEWRKANPNAGRTEIYNDPKFIELDEAEDRIIDEWTAASARLAARAKEIITRDLRKAGYDGVFLKHDIGSWGRKTEAIIALDPEQVKSISNKTPTSNPDIHYSLPILPETEEDRDDRDESWEDEYALTAEEAEAADKMQSLLESGEYDPTGFERRKREVQQAVTEAAALGKHITGAWLEQVEETTKKLISTTKELLDYQYRQGRRHQGHTYEQAVRKIAKEFKKEIGTKLPTEELEKGLSHAAAVLASTGDTNKAWVALKGTVEKAMQQATTEEGSLYDQYADARKYFRKNTIVITKADAADIPDFHDFRKRNTGRMLTRTTENRAEATLDMDWEEICGHLQGLVDSDTLATSDKLLAIAEALNSIYSNREVPMYSATEIQEEAPGRTAMLLNRLATMEFAEITIEDQRLAGLVDNARNADKFARGAIQAGRSEALWEVRKAELALEKMVKELERADLSDARTEQLLTEARQQMKFLNIRGRLSSANTDEAYMEVLRMVERESKKREAELYHAQEQLEMAEGRFAQYAGRLRENREKSELRSTVYKRIKKIQRKVLDNSKSRHVPAMVREPIAQFLSGLDILSKGSHTRGELTKADEMMLKSMSRLREIFSDPGNHGVVEISDTMIQVDGVVLDIPPDLVPLLEKELEKITEAADRWDGGEKKALYEMDMKSLQNLNDILSIMEAAIVNANEYLSGDRGTTMDESAGLSVEEFEATKPKLVESDMDVVQNKYSWESALPAYAFARLGKGAKAVWDCLVEGWEKLAQHAKEIKDFSESTFKHWEVKQWETAERTFTTERGETIYLTDAHIMGLVTEFKRKQARDHITQGGVQITPYKTKGGMQTNGRKFFRLTMGDISRMEGMLTKRQKDVCKALQGFMQETGAKWGNEVTLRRWGIKKFGEKDYYPIKVVQRILHSTKDSSGQNQEYRLINLGASKETKPGANIAVAVSSIFDTYSDHMAEMARYNALALPVVDAMRWFNHTVLDENGVKVQTVNNATQQAFGAPACDYFRKLIQDLNSNTTGENDMATGFARKMLRNYKAAVIAYNLGTVLKQPLSYVKAGYVLKQKHLIRAFGKIEGEGKKKFRQEREQMLEHSGMALWKDLGFYSPDIGPGLKHMIKQDQSWHDKQVEFGMKGAGAADMLTMTRLWIACKWQVAEESKTPYANVDLQRVKSLFNEVIFKTQVVDSTITRTQQMRQTGLWQAMNTAFGGEPTTAMNMLMEGYYEYQDEKRRSGKKNAWQKSKGKLTRGIAVYTFASVAEAIVSSLIDAWRDDDEYQNYWEKYLEALFGKYGLDGNLLGSWLPHNKVFFLKDIVNALSNGGKTNRMDLDGLVNLGKQAGALLESFRLMVGLQDKPTELTGYGKKTWYGLAYDTLKVMGQVSGMGEYNVIRTGKTAWNNAANTWNALVDGFGWNTRKLGKLRSWDGRTENAVLTAFQEGQLTAEEAAEKLQEVRALKGETAYSQNQLYWKLKKADTGYGSTDELDLAVLSGNQDLIAACVKELEDHSDKKPTEPIKAAILRIYRDSLLPEDERNKLYEGQTIDRAKAEQLLRELTEMEEYEIFTALEKKEYAAAHDGEEGFSVYTKVYEAMLAGEDVAPLYEQLEGEGFHEDQITSGSRTLVRTAYQEGELSREETERILGEYYGITKEKDLYEWFGEADYESQGYGDNYSAYKDVYAAVGQGKDISQAVKELVSHGFEEGQVYEQAVDEVHRLYKEGEISEADTVRLLGTYGRTTAELSKASEEAYKKQYGTLPKEGQQRRLTEHEVFWKTEEWKWKKANPDSAEAYSKYAEFYQAVESGRDLKKAIQYYMSHGMTAEQLAGEITRRYKEQYLQLRKEKKFAQAANLAARLLTAWERLGYNRSEMLRKIQKWE